MNTRFASALLLSLMLASTSVMADGRGRDQDDRERDGRYSQRDDRGHADQRDHRDRRYDSGARHFHRGERLPMRYRDRVYIVDDWGHHHLHRPPRHHVWVQVGGDYVLMAVATGIIASIVLSH